MKMRFYHNKIVWITGASSGIGLALAHELSIRGAKLILTSSNAQKLEEVALVCRNKGAICEVLACDLSDHKQVESLSAKAIACYGHIDVVILNAGKSQRSLAVETNIAVDRLLMELDYFSNVIIAKAVAQKMKQSGGGHIAITSSITGKFGFPLRSAYAAAKHALHGFFESLGIEERKNGIFVKCHTC
jgi:short-subunit dehydrogenase